MIVNPKAKRYAQASSGGQINVSYEEYLGVKNKELPALSKMIVNVTKAAKLGVKSGFKKVSAEEQERRHAICQSDCQFYIRNGKYKDRCSKCGCFTLSKSRREAWHCPIENW